MFHRGGRKFVYRVKDCSLDKNQPVATPETESRNSSVLPRTPGIGTQNIKKEPAVQSPIMFNHSLQMLEDVVEPFLDNDMMALLSRTNRTMRGLFKEDLEGRRIQKFLQHVVYGEEAAADSLLEKNPYLLQHFLTDAGTVTDYAGRRIHGTAYQIALGARDPHMLVMLQQHFKKLKNGYEIMQAQYEAQFPAEEEKTWELRQNQDHEELHRVIQAIAAAPDAEACAGAIQAFQAYMDTPKGDEKGIIRTGWHFNTQLLFEAFELNADETHHHQFGGWNSWKNNLVWREVIGYIQRHLPVCLAQDFCQGVKDTVGAGRSLQFLRNPNATFFPLDQDPSFRLGYDYAVNLLGARSIGGAEVSAARFSRFLAEKNRHLTSIHDELAKQCRLSKQLNYRRRRKSGRNRGKDKTARNCAVSYKP